MTQPRQQRSAGEGIDGVPKSSAWASVFTMINTAVGAGVLSFPFAFLLTGWLAGLLVTAGVAAAEAWTLYVLSRFAADTGAHSYSELVRKMLGRGVALLMSAVIFLYLWGSCVAYLIILGDCFQPLAAAVLGGASRCATITLLSTFVILPLCFPRTLGALAGVSAAKFWGIVGVVGAIVARSLQRLLAEADPWAGVKFFSWGPRFWAALPIVVFGFQAHTNVITVFNELCEEPSLCGGGRQQQQPHSPQLGRGQRKSSKLRGMAQVIAVSTGCVALFYCGTAVGYLAFPTNAQSNILNNFPPDDPVMQAARVLVGLMMVASYPVNYHPARAAVQHTMLQLTGARLEGAGFNALATLLFFGSTLGTALLVTKLGTIFQLVGGTCGSLLIFALPGALLIKYATSKHVRSRRVQLHEPLLGGAEGAEEGTAGAAPASPTSRQSGEGKVYSLWTSKHWWAGLALVLLSTALMLVTIHTVCGPTLADM